MIRGFLRGRSALVEGRVILPTRRLTERVNFLLDTGAQYSIIHPPDCKALGIDVMTAFRGATIEDIRGVGGSGQFFSDEAIVSFEHEDGTVSGYRFDDMRFAVPTDYNADYPSLLGMDFITAFELVINARTDIVELR